MTDAEHRGLILGVLRANGLTDQPADYDSDIHSWRCSYPDRYGPCTCLDELADDLMPLVAGWIADARAEGYRDGAAASLREAADLLVPLSGIGMGSQPTRTEISTWLRDRASRVGDS